MLMKLNSYFAEYIPISIPHMFDSVQTMGHDHVVTVRCRTDCRGDHL